ncbi:MAG: DUF1583 domain-containing protein [Planctomycetaceae bacterium]|nr:DUF1583 domain-containing protein [Planctomycetaceae bacterium]
MLPPLTVSQFELATEVAIRAAEHGLPALSRRAVREMLAGGSPVPDVSTSTTPSSSGMFVAAAAASSAAPSAGETNKTERLVASSLLRVVGKWTGPDYPAAEVYELLLPVVLPPARPQEVLLYPDSSQLEQAVVSNAGSVVVDWAAKAGQLEELDRQIVARMPENGFDIPARVIRIEIAIARDDLEGAKAQLEQLADKLLQGLSDSTATLACHAALPATDHPELREPAYRILRTTVKLRAQAAAADRNSNVSIGPLQRKVIRYQSRQGDESEVAAFFEEYLVGRQSYYSRYSGNSGLYRQWSDWASLADEAIQVGALTTALDYLGRTVDFELENYGRPGTREAFAGVLREMQSLPAEERYLRWRDWSLPTEGRRTVRVVVQPLRPNRTPPEFLPADGQALDFLQQDFHSNLYSLLDAAEECGKLDELRGLAEKAVGEKVQNAEFLWPLVLIRMQDLEAVTPVLDQLAATMKERNEPKEGQPRVDIGRDYLVYHAALQRPETAALYMKHRTKLRDQLRNRGGSQYLPRLDADFARARLREMNGSLEPGDDPGLVYWSPATTDTLPSDGIRPWWAVSGPQLVHLGGSGSDSLYFRVPLTGNFEFSVDCVEHNWTESDIGYNGVIVNAQSWGSEMEVTAVDGHESFRQPQPLKRSRPALNRAAVKVQDGTMSYWLNNQQVYSEPISATSPWLHLNTDRPRHASFWNLTLTGEPTIPASVALIDGNRMDGWNTRYFNESQPRHRIMAQKLTSDSHYQLRRDQEREPAEHDWSVQEGVLRARAERSGPEHGQSWAYYHRPLAAGETFAYEFLYRPGQSVAHPTLGRMAYLLNPQGVTTHWIVDRQWDQSLLGIPVENEHVPADGRRGPEALPLRAGEWNAVAVTFDGTNVQIALNGQPVYDAPAVVEPDTRFGLYRLKRQGLEVREAMLTGPWREQFDSLQDLDLLALQQPVDRPTERLLSQLTVEQYSVLDVRRILEVARRSSPERAYDQLVGWVLPSESHPNIRLYFEDSIGGSAADGADPMSQGSSLQVGPVECPAVELIHLALQLGRLEELARAVATVKTFNPPQVRAQQAMSALIAVAAGEDETALEVMRVFDGNLAGSFESNAQSFFIAPEVMVIRAAAHRPRLALAAYQLSQRLVEDARDKKRSSDWQEEASILRGYTETLLARHRELDSPGRSQLTQWSVVPYLKPQDRATGRRPSSWTYRRGSVTHDAGDTWGQLFFQSPLRGKFEIVADRSLYGYREVALSYGLHAAAPSYDLKAIDVTTVMHGNRQVKPLPKLPQLGWKSEFRIQVDGAKISTSVAGQALHEETLAKPPAPWIMLQAHTPQSLSFVHNLRILGEPEIPDELDLLESWNLGLWRGDYYLGSLSSDGSDENAAWRPVGDELFGNLRQDRTIAHRESLVAYQRPMLEDGTIRYEFFYVPGEFEVHPVVGQSAFLLSSDGVMRHELTNAEYEADGRAPNNAAPLSGPAVQPSLKPDDWNLVQLSLAGNRLTISVNEVEVAQVDVPEPNSERFFGLFRYANLTKARVRSIRYRGNWPKSLPAVADQELAIPPDGFLPQPDSHWTSERKIDLTQLPPENGGGDFVLANGALVAEPTPQGLRLHIDNAGGRKTSPTLGANVRAVGDCELTVDFDQLHLTPVTGGWGNALSLKFHLTDSGESYTELALMLNGDGKPNFKVAHQHKRLNGQGRHDQLGMPESYASGRLRFVRLGGTVYGLYAPQGTSDYRCVATAPVGTGPIRRVEIAGISSDNQAVVDFVLTDVTLKTREISAALTRADE